uniref:Uncharacterized protein n=1 Tax=Mycena chlorophos TaxID=658473 RepID=A0ABQ0L2M5_MYCCL|nr:predicted protein [Mycena chlorophos]
MVASFVRAQCAGVRIVVREQAGSRYAPPRPHQRYWVLLQRYLELAFPSPPLDNEDHRLKPSQTTRTPALVPGLEPSRSCRQWRATTPEPTRSRCRVVRALTTGRAGIILIS